MLVKRRFNYYKREYKNPFFRIKKRRFFIFPSLSLKKKFFIFFIFSLLCFLIWFFLYIDYFKIKIIDIDNGGDTNIGEDIKNLAWKQTEDSRFLLGRQNNIFLFNKNSLREEIDSRFSLLDVKITKKFPNKIKISLAEKKYLFIWLEDGKYYCLGAEGEIVSEINIEKLPSLFLPLIENRGNNKIFENKIGFDKKYLVYIDQIRNQLSNDNKIAPEFFILDDLNTVKFKIKQGRVIIYLNPNEDLNSQINKLNALINEKLNDDYKNKEYIDLRYKDKLYYK
jgi:cell division protein FtsQ